MAARKAIHAYLTPEAHDAWHDFAAENGVSVSGLIEAVAQDWASGEGAGSAESESAERLAKLARKIDAQRRRRFAALTTLPTGPRSLAERRGGITGPLGLIGGLAAFHVLDHRVVPERWHVVTHAVAGPVALVAASRLGASARTLGIEREHARAGLATGTRHAALSVGAIGLGLLLPVVAEAMHDPRVADLSTDELAYRVLVEIPVSTALYEELVFRGALLGVLLDRTSVPVAVATTSVLFGLWHVLPALNDREHNQLAGQLPLLASVAPTVAATAVGGALFARLRLRTGSVIAPIIVHTAVNATALLCASLLARRRKAADGPSSKEPLDVA